MSPARRRRGASTGWLRWWTFALGALGVLGARVAVAAPGAANDPNDPYVRASAGPQPSRLALARSLASDCSARGLVLLWLLAHDPTPEVALAAAETAVARCPAESQATCVAMLHYFDEAANDAPAGVLAREALATRDPRAALASASRAERLAWVQRLAPELFGVRPDLAGRRLLRLLAEDCDPEVQQAAGAALMDLDR